MGPAQLRVLGQSLHTGGGSELDIAKAADTINKAAFPVMLCGMFASQPETAHELRKLLHTCPMPVVTTFQVGGHGCLCATWAAQQAAAFRQQRTLATAYRLPVPPFLPAFLPPLLPPLQGAGVLGRNLFELFGGRVGLIHNTLADSLLDMADVVITGEVVITGGLCLPAGPWPYLVAAQPCLLVTALLGCLALHVGRLKCRGDASRPPPCAPSLHAVGYVSPGLAAYAFIVGGGMAARLAGALFHSSASPHSHTSLALACFS